MDNNLPEKFFLAAPSTGGYQAFLYASQHPERIKKLFGISPSFLEPYDETNYDPKVFQTVAEEWSNNLPTQETIAKHFADLDFKDKHPFTEALKLPKCYLKGITKHQISN